MKRARIGFAGRWLVAAPVIAAITAMAGPAAPAAAASAPPMPGTTPTVQGADIAARALFYTGTDSHLYMFTESLGGQLIGGPGAGPWHYVYGRGADNALWVNTSSYWGQGKWSYVGGRLTSRPGVTNGALVVRGADGAVWDRTSTWRSLGGRVLAGSGPATVKVGATLYVLAVGTDRAVWVTQSTDGTHWSGWRWLGGGVSGDLGAASPVPGAGIVFARGTDNAVWYNQFAGTTAGVTPGWHSLGGRLTSGVGAGGGVNAGSSANTIVVAMGIDNRIIERAGLWPSLHPWSS